MPKDGRRAVRGGSLYSEIIAFFCHLSPSPAWSCHRSGTHLHLVETAGLDSPDEFSLGIIVTPRLAVSFGMTKPTITQYEWKGRKLRHLAKKARAEDW